ncbi:MAG: cation-transporting P-type ATPase [Clostridia bacterium]|nr:cation-transporting P-type ATPase [Clostridia bacterium]
MRHRWHESSAAEVLRILESDPYKGLSGKEAFRRRKDDGKNTIYPVIKAPVRSYLIQVLSDLTAILLLAAALLALIFNRDMSALAMLVLLVANYAISIFSYIKAQRVLEDLGSRSLPTAKVIRSGRLLVISQEDVVQGDIILLTSGDVVPCDARLLECDGLRVMENNLVKTEKASLKDASYLRAGSAPGGSSPNMVYASTVVLDGTARAVAVETGPDTMVCRLSKNRPIAACHQLDLIKDLKRLSHMLGVLMLLPVFITAFVRVLEGERLIESFLLSLSVAVASMPELYTAFAYVIVACGMYAVLKDHKKKGAFIKNPPALPRLSKLDVVLVPLESLLCEQMSRVAEIFEGSSVVDLGTQQLGKEGERVLRYALISTGLYGTEQLALKHQNSENIYTRQQETILQAGEQYDLYSKRLEEEYPILEHLDAGEKGSLFETTLVHYKGGYVVVLRGEAKSILNRCTGYYKEGRVLPLDAGARGELLALAGEFSRNNRQPVAIATKNHRYNNLQRIVEAQSDLIFEGFVAIEKPFLPEAAKEVLRLKNAGVKVAVYCAGEAEENRHYARALGIAKDEGQIVRYSQLDEMSEEIFKIKLKNYTLFEGFDGNALRYAVKLLKEEYHCTVGVLGRELSLISAMYEADASFAEEEGRQLTGEKKRDSAAVDPVFARKGSDTGRVGCQALTHLSDVIIPPPSSNGEGGINGVARAIRFARFIYRNVRLLLFYLSFTGVIRLMLLLFSMGDTSYLLPVHALLSGLIVDLGAVMVIAFEKPGKRYVPFYETIAPKRAAGYLRQIIPGAGIGAALCGVTVLISNILMYNRLLSQETLSAFVFVILVLFQFSVLTLLLKSDEPAGAGLHLGRAYLLYALLTVAFLAVFTLVPLLTKASTDFVGWLPLLLAAAVPLFFLIVTALLRSLIGKAAKSRKKT